MTGVLRLLALGTPLGLLLTGCGPTTYLHRVTFGASPQMAQAKVGNAEKMAPYEYTRAREYLYQSMWLAGYARWADSNDFGKKAGDAAVMSREVTQRREKNDELPIYVPGAANYLTRDGQIRRGSPNSGQATDSERPSLNDLDNEKPALGGDADKGKKGGGK